MSEAEAVACLDETIRAGGHAKIAFANAHFVNLAAQDADFRNVLPAFTILPDGAGVDLGSKLLYGEKFPANLNGTDFTPRLLAALAGTRRIVLLGARPGVAERAAARLKELAPRHDYTVLSDGFFDAAKESAMLAQLEASPADVLIVAMGNPLQEKWIARCTTSRHCRTVLGVGALFDFLAGEVVRAPAWVRGLRLEWVWRLAQEPARLWKRYILGNPAFVLRMVWQKARGNR